MAAMALRFARWLAAPVISLAVLSSQPAWAQPRNAERQAALKLGGEALDLYAAGDYAAALEKFTQADELLPAPTLELHIARCLNKLDRLKEAAETYRKVIATELKADAPAVHRDARKQAVPELAKLLEETPTVRATVKGPGAAEAKLQMDGQPIDVALMGEKLTLDPGHYRFEAIVGDRKVVKEIDLDRGEHERVVLHLADETPEIEAPSPADEPTDDGAVFRIAGWASIALGGAGLSLASIMGVMVLGEQDDLLARCPNRQCPEAAHDDARSFETKRILTTTGFIVGGVGLAAGMTLLLLAPAAADEKAALRPLLGPGLVGLEGSF